MRYIQERVESSIILFENEDFPYVRKYFQNLGYKVARYEDVPKQEKEVLFSFEKREAMKNSSYFGAILFLADELPVSDMELKFRHLRTGQKKLSAVFGCRNFHGTHGDAY